VSAWQWGGVAEVRGRAMTGRTRMRHYLTRPARGHGKPREWLSRGTHDRPAAGWGQPRLALSLTGGD
jgi:hypothetical protein